MSETRHSQSAKAGKAEKDAADGRPEEARRGRGRPGADRA